VGAELLRIGVSRGPLTIIDLPYITAQRVSMVQRVVSSSFDLT
jgi:hypothetical protein